MTYNIKEKECFEIGRFNIVKNIIDTESGDKIYTYIKMKPGVVIIPIVGEDFLLIHQYRLAVDGWEWEFPAGTIDNVAESPMDAARRELLEETGYKAEDIIELGVCYSTAGSSDEKIYLFATHCKEAKGRSLDSTEVIKTSIKSKAELLSMIEDNSFRHASGIAGLMKYLLGNQSI